MERLARFTPPVVGAKLTVNTCLPLAAIVALVGDTLNWDASVPVRDAEETVRLAELVFVKVTVFSDVFPVSVSSIVRVETYTVTACWVTWTRTPPLSPFSVTTFTSPVWAEVGTLTTIRLVFQVM